VTIIKTLLLFIFLFGLTSFQKHKFECKFTISANQVNDRVPKSINIQIVNNGQSTIKLNILVLNFYIDEEGFWGIADNIRFGEKGLLLSSNHKFNKTIHFDSLTFTSFDKNKSVSLYDLKNKIKNSKKTSIKASLSDIKKLDNPLESSSLTWSNLIEMPR
jgi:hypothetical protein